MLAFLMPVGNWAEWAGAVGTIAVLVVGAWQWRTDRRRSIYLDASSQARQVAGWAVPYESGDATELVVWIRNASTLPIYDVFASAHGFKKGLRPPMRITEPSETIDVLLPDRQMVAVAFPLGDEDPDLHWKADWHFTDVAGVTWHRDGYGRLDQFKEKGADKPYQW